MFLHFLLSVLNNCNTFQNNGFNFFNNTFIDLIKSQFPHRYAGTGTHIIQIQSRVLSAHRYLTLSLLQNRKRVKKIQTLRKYAYICCTHFTMIRKYDHIQSATCFGWSLGIDRCPLFPMPVEEPFNRTQ